MKNRSPNGDDLKNRSKNIYFKQKIDEALKDDNSTFIIGDAKGCDLMTQKYLNNKTKNIIIYHMFNKPRNNPFNFQTVGSFSNDEERDDTMTKNSDIDILWIRPKELQKKLLGDKYKAYHVTGTEKNKLRREHIIN